MKREIICAGFGGQGILLFGKVLAQAGMVEGLAGYVSAVLRTRNARRDGQLPCDSGGSADRFAIIGATDISWR